MGVLGPQKLVLKKYACFQTYTSNLNSSSNVWYNPWSKSTISNSLHLGFPPSQDGNQPLIHAIVDEVPSIILLSSSVLFLTKTFPGCGSQCTKPCTNIISLKSLPNNLKKDKYSAKSILLLHIRIKKQKLLWYDIGIYLMIFEVLQIVHLSTFAKLHDKDTSARKLPVDFGYLKTTFFL